MPSTRLTRTDSSPPAEAPGLGGLRSRGQPVEALLCRACADGSAGTEIILTVETDGQRRSITLVLRDLV